MKSGVVRAITIRQPWARLIVEGVKTVECRSWRCRLVGERVAIHAARTIGSQERGWCRELGALMAGVDLEGEAGCIIGTVVIDRVTREVMDGDWHEPGTWGWYFRDPERVRPFSARGALGLWRLDGKTAKEAEYPMHGI